MNIPRLFAHAFVRRIAYVAVALALAWLGIGESYAQVASNPCPNYAAGCSLPVAFSACEAFNSQSLAANPNQKVTEQCTRVIVTASQGYVRGSNCTKNSFGDCASGTTVVRLHYYSSGCPAGQEWNDFSFACQQTCSSRGNSVKTAVGMIPTGSVGCDNGCHVVWSANGDGTYTTTPLGGAEVLGHCYVVPNNCEANGPGYFLNPGLGVCQPTVAECAENQVKDPATGKCSDGCPSGMFVDVGGVCKPKEEDCPPGNVRAPSGECLPGEGQCAAGEARRENGTCGRDANGDGVADEDDEDPENDPEESFAGGDNCASPPSCSGGVIDCGMARIQWRIDCNTRRTVNVTGGACSAMPVCVGENCKAMEYAQLLQQWRAACALEKMAGAEDGEGPVGDANRNGVADALEGRFTPSDGGEDGETAVRTIEVSSGWLDQENIFGGGSCPAPISFDLMGKSISSADFEHWCNGMAIFRVLILVFGTWTAIQILLGRWL